MFHIKNDERFLHSSELLYRGLVALMKEKPFEKISYQELSKVSTVSRATIYRNFDSLEDILYWKCSTKFAEILGAYVATDTSTRKKDDFLIHVFQAWSMDSEVLERLMEIGRIDIIFRCFKENAHIIMEHMKDEISLIGAAYDYFISIRIGIFVGVISVWLDRGKQETTDQIVEMMISQLRAAEKSAVYY